MRWTREDPAEKRKRKAKEIEAKSLALANAQMVWHRKFAWLPKTMTDSRQVVWLEHYWSRAKVLDKVMLRRQGYPYHQHFANSWEHRTGTKEAPDVKERPAQIAPSAAPVDTQFSCYNEQTCTCQGRWAKDQCPHWRRPITGDDF